MTDFLSRLVERSVGRAAVARPVVPPLFAAGASLGAEPVEEEPTGGAGSAERPEPAASAPTRPLPPSVDAPPREPPSASPAPDSAEVAMARQERPHSPRPAVAGDRLRVRLVRDAASAMAPDRAPLTAPDAGEKATPAPLSPESAIELRPRDALFPRTAARAEASASPPGPIVRISIGRIDVRAAPPARPAGPGPAPVRKDDRLSLEEYLRPRDRRR